MRNSSALFSFHAELCAPFSFSAYTSKLSSHSLISYRSPHWNITRRWHMKGPAHLRAPRLNHRAVPFLAFIWNRKEKKEQITWTLLSMWSGDHKFKSRSCSRQLCASNMKILWYPASASEWFKQKKKKKNCILYQDMAPLTNSEGLNLGRKKNNVGKFFTFKETWLDWFYYIFTLYFIKLIILHNGSDFRVKASQ